MVNRVVEFTHLIFLALQVKGRECCEAFLICRRYFFSWRFVTGFVWLKVLYLFDNPYRVSRRYCRQQGDSDPYQYGETPLTTLHRIMDKVMMLSGKTGEPLAGCHVFELGAGSGYTSIWLNTVLDCKVTAIDLVPAFCRRLASAVRLTGLKNVEVRCEDYLLSDLSGAAVIYLYGSNLDDVVINQLIHRLANLPPGVLVVTVSYSLQSYAPEMFRVLLQFPEKFYWGEAEVFIQELCPKKNKASEARTSDARTEVC